MVELTVAQAEEILDKERAYMIAHGGDEQVEAYNMAIRALNNYAKLENIKQIVKKELSPLSIDEMSSAEIQIREIIEKE